ncbi:hypothetical protein FF38_02870 [Lucilia cuprina]|uniref:Uncharacterized protein n=1 Tax=Lucilia cuprina TaxID=7375 RepID=A0A0L0CLB0_LUCCU|nr:hypothetical protein CVS40_10874 [Lucilia cuprina]KNC33031.1 hypothetical protein FF38_02870 [Lucilia cuprina]
MKSSKVVRQQYGNTERGKNGKRSEKSSKLDRKSSRGMIYENEELRLRTININAEVERGQTDIKRLRKENEQLRREIWTLRDECDRLNKRVKAKFIEHEHGVYSVRCSGGNNCSCQYNEGGGACDGVHSRCNSEDSDSCDSCCCHDEDDVACNEECCNESKKLADIAEGQQITEVLPQNDTANAVTTEASPTGPSKLTNFDHLSVVSEETLSNSEVALTQPSENLLGYTPDISGSQTTLPSLVGPLTPLTPIELVANELNDLQAVVPPLSYFENVLQQHMDSNFGSTPESSSTTNSGKTIVRHTNGWDYNLESPFAQRRYQANSISPIMTKRSPAQTLTTFVPTTTVTPPPPPPTDIATTNGKPALPKKPTDLSVTSPVIETVPITILPPNGCASAAIINNGDNNGNTTPKHFFAPIKPKLKLNTALANQKRLPPPPPPVTETVSQTQSLMPQHKCEPPDIYVTNALASPYRPPNKPTVQPPPIPQRITSTSTIQAQVSSTQHQRNRQQLHHRRQHQMRRYQQHNNVAVANNDDVYVMPTISTTITSTNTNAKATISTTTTITTAALNCTNTLCTSMQTNLKTFCPLLTTMTTTTVLTSNSLCNSLNPLLTTPTTISSPLLTAAAAKTVRTTTSLLYLTSTTCPPAACFKFINSNINFRKPNDPVYAIAQNVCHNLITATAVTQPLMSSIVKCCIAKQQQLQLQQRLPIPTAASSSTAAQSFRTSTTITSAIAAGGGGCIDIMPPLPPAQTTVSPTSTTSSSSPSSLSSMAKLSSVSCNLTINSSFKKPITTSLRTSTTSTNCIVVDSMCQTDSANLESILNDIEAISEDILAIQLIKNKSRDNLNNKSTDSINTTEQQPLQQNNKNNKPYRSEMNLLLTYEGDNPTIKPAETNDNSETSPESNTNTARRTRSLERDHTDSPSPHIPDPMQPFPENRKYIGFDRINKAAIIATTTAPMVAATATQTSPITNSPLNQRAQLPLSPLVTNVNTPKTINGKQLPPTPPNRSYPTPLNIKCAGIARSSSVTGCLPTTDSSTNSPVLAGVSPNKSQLYAALANAAAKRAQFRSQPTHITRSLDMDSNMPENINDDDINGVKEEKESTENAKRKARRVSIVCADTDSPGTPEKPSPALRTQMPTFQVQPTTSGSCMDLHAVMTNPALRNIKQTSQSTPNTPHSSRKVENSPLAITQLPPTISITPNPTPEHQRNNSNTSGISQLLAHNHGHSNSYPNVVSPLTKQHQQPRKNSQDAIKASAAEIACAAANAMRSKCSRRHSDGTVSHGNQRISGASGGTNGTHHHHQHNHHHHQHSSSLVSNTNPHHSHHSRRDSNHETVASFSDRNSNSLASSRESSASFSLRSQRRKLSVSSHTGGKIPWCGCWGNGCL